MTTARKSPRAAPDWVGLLSGIPYLARGLCNACSVAHGVSSNSSPPPRDNDCELNSRILFVSGATYTAQTVNPGQVLVALNACDYRTIKYTVQASHLKTSFQSCEISLIHDDNGNISIVQYANNTIGSNLAQFDADIVGGKIRLLTTPSAAGVVFNVLIIAIIN